MYPLITVKHNNKFLAGKLIASNTILIQKRLINDSDQTIIEHGSYRFRRNLNLDTNDCFGFTKI